MWRLAVPSIREPCCTLSLARCDVVSGGAASSSLVWIFWGRVYAAVRAVLHCDLFKRLKGDEKYEVQRMVLGQNHAGVVGKKPGRLHLS